MDFDSADDWPTGDIVAGVGAVALDAVLAIAAVDTIPDMAIARILRADLSGGKPMFPESPLPSRADSGPSLLMAPFVRPESPNPETDRFFAAGLFNRWDMY